MIPHPQRIEPAGLRQTRSLDEQIRVRLESEVRNEQAEARGHERVSFCE